MMLRTTGRGPGAPMRSGAQALIPMPHAQKNAGFVGELRGAYLIPVRWRCRNVCRWWCCTFRKKETAKDAECCAEKQIEAGGQ
jgi:hypothetical protein